MRTTSNSRPLPGRASTFQYYTVCESQANDTYAIVGLRPTSWEDTLLSPPCAKATARATRMRCLKLPIELLPELTCELSARLAARPGKTQRSQASPHVQPGNKVAHQRHHLPPCIPAHQLPQVAPHKDCRTMRVRNSQRCKGNTCASVSPQSTISTALRLRDCASKVAFVGGCLHSKAI